MKRLSALLLALILLCPAHAADAPPPPVTRGQFVYALWAHWGSVPYRNTACFSDVSADAPYTAAVCWAHDLGLVLGVGDGRFEPERPITREEAAVFLRRAGNHIGRNTETVSNLAMCNDYADISPWADDSLYWCTEAGLIPWAEGGLRAPYGTLSPEEVSAIFTQF